MGMSRRRCWYLADDAAQSSGRAILLLACLFQQVVWVAASGNGTNGTNGTTTDAEDAPVDVEEEDNKTKEVLRLVMLLVMALLTIACCCFFLVCGCMLLALLDNGVPAPFADRVESHLYSLEAKGVIPKLNAAPKGTGMTATTPGPVRTGNDNVDELILDIQDAAGAVGAEVNAVAMEARGTNELPRG